MAPPLMVNCQFRYIGNNIFQNLHFEFGDTSANCCIVDIPDHFARRIMSLNMDSWVAIEVDHIQYEECSTTMGRLRVTKELADNIKATYRNNNMFFDATVVGAVGAIMRGCNLLHAEMVRRLPAPQIPNPQHPDNRNQQERVVNYVTEIINDNEFPTSPNIFSNRKLGNSSQPSPKPFKRNSTPSPQPSPRKSPRLIERNLKSSSSTAFTVS